MYCSLKVTSLFLVVTEFTGDKNKHYLFFFLLGIWYDKCNCSTKKAFPAEGTNHKDCGLSLCKLPPTFLNLNHTFRFGCALQVSIFRVFLTLWSPRFQTWISAVLGENIALSNWFLLFILDFSTLKTSCIVFTSPSTRIKCLLTV